MWSDNETTQDLLGYQVHADLLKKIILNDDMLPISIGVFGNWGSGKSSLMLLLQKSLHEWEKSQHEKGCKIILQVYFNSWQFESYDSTKLTIIIRKSKFPPNPERSVQFSGKRTKRSVQKKGCTQHL